MRVGRDPHVDTVSRTITNTPRATWISGTTNNNMVTSGRRWIPHAEPEKMLSLTPVGSCLPHEGPMFGNVTSAGVSTVFPSRRSALPRPGNTASHGHDGGRDRCGQENNQTHRLGVD